MRSTDQPPRPKHLSETDPRFPSGEWAGIWIQRGSGKQKMSLQLTFCGGNLSVAGSDIVGQFRVRGTYDLKSGRCHLDKKYEGAHRVLYDGTSEGEELWLWGIWELAHERGGFHIWPKGANDPTQRGVKVANAAPVSTKGRISRIPVELPRFKL